MYKKLGLLGLVAGLVYYFFKSGPKIPPETDAVLDRIINDDLPELIRGKTGFAVSDGLQIWYEFIDPHESSKGTVLLAMSIGGSGIEWTTNFVDSFLNAGYNVIRYDHRGTGLSDRVTDWDRRNPYTIADMARDALAILDELAIPKAHVVGLSMGGMVAQEIAIQRPQKVASLTLLLTSGNIGDPDLPMLTSRYLIGSTLKNISLFKYRMMGGEKNLIKERIAKTIVFLGYDNLDIEEIAHRTLYDLRKRRGLNFGAVFQHQMAVTVSGSRYEKLAQLQVPTLVIHGTADQLIPIEHGKKLVDVMPNAQGIWLDGMEHVFPFPQKFAINEKIINHLDCYPTSHN